MIVNEKRASTLWCPEAVASHTDPRAGFRDGDTGTPTFPCLGPRCMAWRWFGFLDADGLPEPFDPIDISTEFDTVKDDLRERYLGYCGKAGTINEEGDK